MLKSKFINIIVESKAEHDESFFVFIRVKIEFIRVLPISKSN